MFGHVGRRPSSPPHSLLKVIDRCPNQQNDKFLSFWEHLGLCLHVTKYMTITDFKAFIVEI